MFKGKIWTVRQENFGKVIRDDGRVFEGAITHSETGQWIYVERINGVHQINSHNIVTISYVRDDNETREIL